MTDSDLIFQSDLLIRDPSAFEVFQIGKTDELIRTTRNRLECIKHTDLGHQRHNRMLITETLRLVASRLFDQATAEVKVHQRITDDGRREVTFQIVSIEDRPLSPAAKEYRVGYGLIHRDHT